MWYADFTIGAIILISIVIIFFINVHNLEEGKSSDAHLLIQQGSSISDSLMTSGVPKGWTNDTVSKIGLMDSQRVNLTLLDNLKSTQYDRMRQLFKITDDFVLFFEDKAGCLQFRNGIALYGDPRMTVTSGTCVKRSSIDTSVADNLIPLTRYVIYNGTPARMVVYAWN